MADARSPLGSTGETVRGNVRRLRESQNLTYAELSRRLADVGRSIPTLGLRRLEAGDRRVDADDLVALAVALGVAPATLLMPESSTPDQLVSVTGLPEPVEAEVAWLWLEAARPVVWTITRTPGGGASADGRQMAEFRLRALPSWLAELRLTPALRHPARVALERLQVWLSMVLGEPINERAGDDMEHLRGYHADQIERELGELQRLADDLRAGVDVRAQVPRGDG